MSDPDLHLARALLVDNNPLLRSVASAQLKAVGVGLVTQASRIRDARTLIEREHFDIILCNREFDGLLDNGQDLLDELRRENQLPPSTVFLMVTSKPTYHQVMEAAESALDGILLRPYTSAMLSDRLLEARRRKRALFEVLDALEQGQSDLALSRALKRFQEQAPYAAYCGRVAAELLLLRGRHQDARLLFEKLATGSNPTWARLGMARALLAAQQNIPARRLIEAVLAQDPAYADAHDLLGRILVEQCEFEAALLHYRQAAALTPGCLLRRQHAGALAFYLGQAQEALQTLQSALALGAHSKLFDALTLLLVAFLRHDQQDLGGVEDAAQQLRGYQERFPESQRLSRFCIAIQILIDWGNGQVETGIEGLQSLAQEVLQDNFDLEAATMVLMLWARSSEDGQQAGPQVAPQVGPEAPQLLTDLQHLAMRFCVSKAITEVLVAAAGRSNALVSLIRECQGRISAAAEQAMDLALKGDVRAAVTQLTNVGAQTLNARLLELACTLARRYGSDAEEAERLLQPAAALLRRSCRAPNHIAGIQRAGRSPGGLLLRGPLMERKKDVSAA